MPRRDEISSGQRIPIHSIFIIQLPINLLFSVGGFCLWLYLMYAAYQGKTFQLPVIGPLAASQAGIATVGTGQRL